MVLSYQEEQTIEVREQADWVDFSLKALTTLPLTPKFGRITFSALGVQIPEGSVGIKDSRKYYSMCDKLGIITNSKISMHGDEKGSIWKVSSSDELELNNGMKERIIRGLMLGQKINEIGVGFGLGMYKGFVDNLLPELTRQGYQIGGGFESYLDFATVPGCGSLRDTGFEIYNHGPGRLGLELTIGKEISKGDATKLEEWYSSLKGEYATEELKIGA